MEKEHLNRSARRAVEVPSLHVDSIKRNVGRPKYNEALSGREQIVLRTKEFMRVHSFRDVQRKELAEFLGVTPALISYYFRDKHDLILEASSEEVMSYSVNVTEILKGTGPVLERTKNLIYEFIDFHLSTGYTLDYYLNSIQRLNRVNELSLMAEQYMDILKFIEELLAFSGQSQLQASFLQSSIWGQCMYLGRQPHLKSMVGDLRQAEVSASLTDSVFNLLMNGLREKRADVTQD